MPAKKPSTPKLRPTTRIVRKVIPLSLRKATRASTVFFKRTAKQSGLKAGLKAGVRAGLESLKRSTNPVQNRSRLVFRQVRITANRFKPVRPVSPIKYVSQKRLMADPVFTILKEMQDQHTVTRTYRGPGEGSPESRHIENWVDRMLREMGNGEISVENYREATRVLFEDGHLSEKTFNEIAKKGFQPPRD